MCLSQMRGIFCSHFIQAEHDMTEMLVFCIKTTNINITFDGSKQQEEKNGVILGQIPQRNECVKLFIEQ